MSSTFTLQRYRALILEDIAFWLEGEGGNSGMRCRGWPFPVKRCVYGAGDRGAPRRRPLYLGRSYSPTVAITPAHCDWIKTCSL